MFHSSGLTRLRRVLWKQHSGDLSDAELITVWRRCPSGVDFNTFPYGSLRQQYGWGLSVFIHHTLQGSVNTVSTFQKKHQKHNMLFALPRTQAESHPSCCGKPSLRGVCRAWCGSGEEGDSWEPSHLRSCGGLYVDPALWDACGLLWVVAVLSQLRPGFQTFPFCSQVPVCFLVRQCSVQGNR